MLSVLFYLMIIMAINFMFLIMNIFFSILKKNNYEKNLPFECGFNLITKSNLPFSLPFYFMALMFLIFDVEILLLLPLMFNIFNLNSYIMFLIIILFIFTLIIILLIEWFLGYLNWLF